MTAAARIPFDSDSDEDSIATDSTAESEPRDDYPVERILLEDTDEDDQRVYLIKWETYPLHRSTWEPRANISDICLRQWEQCKARIQSGTERPFNYEDFTDAVERHEAEREVREARRKKKRRRRGIHGSPDDSDEEEDEPVVRSVPRKRVRQVTVKRKGIAHKVVRRGRAGQTPSSSDTSQSDISEVASEADSLVEELGEKPETPQAAPDSRATRLLHPSAKSQAKKEEPTLKSQPYRTGPLPVAPPKMKPPEPVVSKPAKSTLARKTAPSVPSRPVEPAQKTKVPVNIFASTGNQLKRRHRARVSGETPKDSFNTKFSTLAMQRKFQLYSRNEKAPDPNALNFLNTKTGQILQPIGETLGVEPQPSKTKPVGHDKAAAANASSAYSRRTPPPIRRERSPTPPSPRQQRRASSVQHNLASVTPADPLQRTQTCEFWLKGKCRNTAETCPFAHYPISSHVQTNNDSIPNKKKTCFFWRTRGKCKKSETECEFAHYQTPYNADPPTGWLGSSYEASIAHPTQLQPSLPDPRPNIETRHEDTTDSFGPAPIAPKLLTCYFFGTFGKCTNNSCQYAHHYTGQMAQKPGTFKKGSKAFATNEPLMSRTDIEGRESNTFPPIVQTNNLDLHRSMDGVSDRREVQSPSGISVPIHELVQSPLHTADTTDHSTLNQRGLDHPPMSRQTTLEDVTIKFAFQSDELSMLAKLEIFDRAQFLSLAGPQPVLEVHHMILASDFEHLVWSQEEVAKESVFGGISLDQSQVAMFENITELCKARSAAFVANVQGHDLQMLIYPGVADEYKFFQPFPNPTSTLHFRLFRSPHNLAPVEHAMQDLDRQMVDQSAEVSIGEEICGLDHKILFNLPDEEDAKEHNVEPRALPKTVFLMFPPDRDVEVDAYIRYFQGRKLAVYHSGIKGAWAYYRKRHLYASLIVIHSKVPLWEIPGLHSYLAVSSSHLVCVGTQQTTALSQAGEPQLGCERLFPHGIVVLITDDLFLYHPSQAIMVLEAFLIVNEEVPDALRHSRIVARPGVLEWLQERALQHNERGRADERWEKLYGLVGRLGPPDDGTEPAHFMPEATRTPLLVTPMIESVHDYRQRWEESEAATTDFMVNWFAGWSVLNAGRHRKFVVCFEAKSGSGSSPEVDGWSRKYQHVGVHPPSTVLKMLEAKRRK